MAQSTGAAGPAAVQQEATTVDEIVVTANRRSQALTDVGASVVSVGGEELLSRGVTSVSDLAKIVPGFTAAETGYNVPVYSLRGVGFNDPSLASNSTVAVSVDEVPLPYTSMTQGAVLDLRRLEVLKGPQGTLYGQNATGGAINYIANKPSDTFAAGAQLGYGTFNTFTGEAFVTGPLTETLTARLAVSGTHGGPWQESYTRDDSLGEQRKVAGRLSLHWQPSDRLSADFIASGWKDGSETSAAQIVGFRAQSPANIFRLPQVFSYPLTPTNARAADWAPGQDYSRDDTFYQLALKVNYDFSETLRLSSITAYSSLDTESYTDRDGMIYDNFNAGASGTIKSIYQELRISGEAGGLTWSAGANYRSDDVHDYQLADIAAGTNSYSAGFHFDTPFIRADTDVETYAFFADGEYQLNDQWSLVGGLRYTKDQRDFNGCTGDNGVGDTAALYSFLQNLFRDPRGLPRVPALQAGQCTTLAKDTFIGGEVVNSLAEDNVAFRGGVNFKPTPGSLLYASYSRGFKAGAFPTLGAAFAVGFDPATQEQLDATEVGFKTNLFSRRLNLSGAVFNYEYTDKQLRGRIIDSVAGSLSKLVNIPESVIRGAELEVTANPMDGLNLYTSVSYLDTEIKEFVGINLFSVTENFAGQTLNYSPPWSVNLGGEYRWDVSDNLNAFVGADAAYRSRTSGFLGRDPLMDVKQYTTLDLRVGIESADGRWSASLWGANVTDTYYWTTTNRGSDTLVRNAAKPATYGVLFRVAY